MKDQRYPIGQFESPEIITDNHIQEWKKDIKLFPERIRLAVKGLDETALNWTYRPEGWSIKQLVHHCADSHINAFTRFKLAITEERPSIRPYIEGRWAELPDVLEAPIELSLQLIDGLHARWTILLEHLTTNELKRSFIHPEHQAEFSVEETIGNYAWHCNHHLAHIELAKENGSKGT